MDTTPAADGADTAPGGTANRGERRGPRGWVLDALLFLGAALTWAYYLLAYSVGLYAYVPSWLVLPALVLGAVACLALWWRRSHPHASRAAVAAAKISSAEPPACGGSHQIATATAATATAPGRTATCAERAGVDRGAGGARMRWVWRCTADPEPRNKVALNSPCATRCTTAAA